MQIGQLDRRITIQGKTVVQDGAGQDVETWSDVVTVWGKIVPQRSGEQFVAQQVVGENVVTFLIRYRDGVTVLNRLLFDGKTWDILDVRLIGRRNGLELDAKARSET